MNSTELQTLATQVRRDIVRMVHAVQSGHPGGSLGCTDLLVQLYFSTMNINPDEFDMDGKGEDIFFSPMDTSARYGTAFWHAADTFL